MVAPGSWLSVCRESELHDGETAVFAYARGGQRLTGFVLNVQGKLRAFANNCPHWNIDLDLGDERFYDPSLGRIYCKNHAATFLPDSGACDFGPCFGRSLEGFEVRSHEGQVEVLVPGT